MPRVKAAIDNPVMASPHETQFDPSMVPQRAPIENTLEMEYREPIELDADGMKAAKAAAMKPYYEELRFAEDPITIIITPSGDRNAPKHVRCAVQGKGAEVWDEGSKRWIEFTWLPVGKRLITKRKYAEVLARSRTDTFRTEEVTATPNPNQDGFRLVPETTVVAPFNVIHDPAGERGHQWYQRVMTEF